MTWAAVWALLQVIWSAAAPEVKALALAELQKLVAQDAGKHPFLDELASLAEDFLTPTPPAAA